MHKAKKFQTSEKTSDTRPTFKGEDPLDKTNYKSISLLPTVLKILERILFHQLQRFYNKFMLPLPCQFSKWYSAQYAFINLPHK